MVGFFKRNNWLEKWKEEFGGITSYSFMIYGPMTIRDQAILNHGLTMQIMKRGMNDLRFHNIQRKLMLSWLNYGECKEDGMSNGYFQEK